jgi:VIT1/CCC1 family predicted Fe2+/Mn2+ transporter
MLHIENHKIYRIGWLRAAVLGANDGIVSSASLILGVAAAGADANSILIAGIDSAQSAISASHTSIPQHA